MNYTLSDEQYQQLRKRFRPSEIQKGLEIFNTHSNVKKLERSEYFGFLIRLIERYQITPSEEDINYMLQRFDEEIVSKVLLLIAERKNDLEKLPDLESPNALQKVLTRYCQVQEMVHIQQKNKEINTLVSLDDDSEISELVKYRVECSEVNEDIINTDGGIYSASERIYYDTEGVLEYHYLKENLANISEAKLKSIEAALNLLSPLHRIIFERYVFKRTTLAAIAEGLNIPRTDVMQCWKEVKQALNNISSIRIDFNGIREVKGKSKKSKKI